MRIKIYYEFYHCIMYVANEGCHVRIIPHVLYATKQISKNRLLSICPMLGYNVTIYRI